MPWPTKFAEAVLCQLASLFGVGYEAIHSEFLDSITSHKIEDRWAGWGCPFATLPTGTMSDASPEAMRENHGGPVNPFDNALA